MQRTKGVITMLLFLATLSIAMGKDAMASDLEIASEATQEIIEPFGGIKWDDNLVQLIVKLSAIKGIQHVRLSLNDAEADVRKVSKRGDLEKTLSDLMLKYNPRIFKDLKPTAENYSGENGAKRKYMRLTPKITASPIIISGVAFELKATFEIAPGLEVVNAEAVPIEKRGGHSFPLVISEVSLVSSSASLANSYQNIISMIETKYRKFDPETNLLMLHQNSSMEGNVSDIDGNTFHADISSNRANRIYRGAKCKSQLNEAYRKHLAAAEKKANAGKAEMGSGL